MVTDPTPPQADLTPPPGFEYNPDILADYEEQVQMAVGHANYQALPVPSFEDVPRVDIRPTFNPTNAPESEIYAKNRTPDSLRKIGQVPRSEHVDTNERVQMWRIVERSKVEDGTGLVSSSILQTGSLGDVEGLDPAIHLASNDEGRMKDPDSATPFVSFSTDPENLARNVILKYGFGIKDGRDPVVVQIAVDPARVISGPYAKAPEDLLLGGVSPEEYIAAYRVEDFVRAAMPDQAVTTIHGDTLPRDQLIGHWAMRK